MLQLCNCYRPFGHLAKDLLPSAGSLRSTVPKVPLGRTWPCICQVSLMWGLTRCPGCLVLVAAKAYRNIYLTCLDATHPSAQLNFIELTYPHHRLSLRIAGNFGQSDACTG